MCMGTSWQERVRPWHVFGIIAVAASLVLLRGAFNPVCHGVFGLSTITLTTHENARVGSFCVDGFECAGGLTNNISTVFVDDGERLEYTYTASIDVDGETLRFNGDVRAEPQFPNGRRCGRSGKTATLVMTEERLIEDRT